MSGNASKPKVAQAVTPSKTRRRKPRQRNMVVAPGPNQTEVRKQVRNPFLRLTPGGRNWLRNYLNPCGESENGEVGIPDGSSTMAAHKNSRVDVSIECPAELAAVVDKNQTQQGGNWWLSIIVPPWVDDCVLLLATGVEPTKAPESLYTLLVRAALYPKWQKVEPGAAVSFHHWIARLPSPGLPVGPGRNEDGDNVDYASQFRYTKRGVTCHLIADDLTNRGAVTAAQWFCKPQPEVTTLRNTVGSSHALVRAHLAWSVLTGEITPAKLTAADERTYQGVAKDGCYMPIYRSGSDFSYQPYAQRAVFLHALTDGVFNPEVAPEDDTAAGGYTQSEYVRKTIDHTQNIGVIWFRGISTKATVRIKGRYSIQAVIEPGSPWAADSRIGPVRDDVALTTAMTIQNDVAQAYPAHYNDWGWLGGIVKNLIGKIPVIGGVAQNLFEPLGTALGSVFGRKI